MAPLRMQRGPVRAMLTKTSRELQEELEKEDRNHLRCHQLFRRMEEQKKKIENLNEKINELLLLDPTAAQENFDEEFASVNEYEELFFNVQVLYESKYKEVAVANPENEDSVLSVKPEALVDKKTKYRLPKLELAKFGGDPRDWLRFWSQFSSIHEDPTIPAVEKFQYLLQSMSVSSRAREVVESFPPSAENYTKAVTYLKERFGQEDVLVEVYVRDMLRLVLDNATKKNMKISVLYDRLETQLRALATLGVTQEKYAAMLYPLVESCLPEDILRTWERQRHLSGDGRQDGALEKLMKFLRGEVDGEERILLAKGFSESSSSYEKNKKFREKTNENSVATAVDLFSGANEKFQKFCLFCEKKHESADCYSAARFPLEKKKKMLAEKRACFVCLKKGHMARECKSSTSCSTCGGRHFALMCSENKPKTTDQKKTEQGVTNLTSHSTGRVMLQTLVVTVKGSLEERRVRVLIDTGSQRSYVSEKLVAVLQLKSCGEVKLSHSLFGGVNTSVKTHQLYEVHLESLDGMFQQKFEVLDQPVICGSIARGNFGSWLVELQQKGVQLTDVGDGCPDIHVLIGADFAGQLFTGKVMKTKSGPVAMQTRLGWTVMGTEVASMSEESSAHLVTSLAVTDADIQCLWKLDTIGIVDSSETKSREEEMQSAQQHFLKTVQINKEGRYEVTLPWIECHPPIANNFFAAKRRLLSATQKLKEQGQYLAYQQVIDTWESEGVVEKVSFGGSELVGSYLPHRPVFKPSSLTTPVRPVFDASAKSRGFAAVNECMEKGPNLIELIPDIMIQFRMKRVGVVSDIKKAFLQISVRDEDREFIRFLWWNESGQEIQEYRHCRVVFGVTCSPFILAATLNFHLDKFISSDAELVRLLKSSTYIDNCVSSLSSEDETLGFLKRSTEIMSKGKFDLRNWVWSGQEPMGGLEYESVLGMLWNPKKDILKLDLSGVCRVDEEVITDRSEEPGVGLLSSECGLGSKRSVVTKREILSAAHRIFDSVGFSSPVTVVPKILLQEVCSKKLNWDDPVDDSVKKQFLKWKNELSFLAEVEIPRWILGDDFDDFQISLHVFSDASVSAYAGCVFVRGVRTNGEVTVQLTASRSRVAPAKKTTIPRLELLGCLIAVRLATSVKKKFWSNLKTTFWTDSSNALHWIQKNENWATFVWNRVEEIRRLSDVTDWRHIPGESNPADLPSRGCGGKALLASRWWEGPSWLRKCEDQWPKSTVQVDLDVVGLERKKVVAVNSSFSTVLWYHKRFSSWRKAVRTVAVILRWKNLEKINEMTVERMTGAEMCIWKSVQKTNFQDGQQLLHQLNAVRCEDGLFRVKTKLLMRDDSEEFRLPILLPSKDELVQLYLKHLHEWNSHCGVQVMLSILREKFWLLQARRTLKTIVAKCLKCRRFSTKSLEVKEAPLPADRVRNAAVFEVIGVDLGGPLYLKEKQKSWFVLFTCAVYRAVHLELVSSLSTDGFLQAFRRFIGRRGRPAIIYSDNATNFEGASNAMHAVDWKKIQEFAVDNRIQWKFSPPSAPWWGGFWERMVGLTKKILRRVLGRAALTYEELVTVLVDAEDVINSRPLTYCSEDLNDLIPLTPNMFLREIRSGGVLDLDELDSKSLNKRLQYRQKLREDLRSRFRTEYLGLLVHRKKTSSKCVFKVGALVLIQSDVKKRQDWPLGIVEELFAGKDGVERVARVKTSQGIFTRPVKRLFPLELTTDEGQRIANGIPGGIVTRSGRRVKPVVRPI